MKPDTYDTIIDTTKELCSYSGWFLLTAFVGAFVLAIVYLITVEWLKFQLSIMFFIIIDLVVSFLIIIFVFMVKKTHERFGVKYWRDFWMAFGHPINIPFDNQEETEQEIKKWIDENTPRLYRILEKNFRDSTIKIVFRHKRDAMACKLKWS